MGGGGGVTRPCARARQAKRVLTQGRRGVQGRRDKSLKMILQYFLGGGGENFENTFLNNI